MHIVDVNIYIHVGVAHVATIVAVNTAPKSGFAEAFKQIRTNLQFASSKTDARVYLTSSPGPGDGKSTLISNLAVAIAQTGKKVIMFDGDLRRPTVHRRFQNTSRDVGLSNYLSDNTLSLDSVLQNTEIDGVRVVTSGPIPPNPSELLDSVRMKEAVNEANWIEAAIQMEDSRWYQQVPNRWWWFCMFI